MPSAASYSLSSQSIETLLAKLIIRRLKLKLQSQPLLNLNLSPQHLNDKPARWHPLNFP